MTARTDFVPLSLCVMTVSDSRTAANDTSGDYLCTALRNADAPLVMPRICAGSFVGPTMESSLRVQGRMLTP